MIKASSSVVEKEQDGKKYIRADLLSDTKEEILVGQNNIQQYVE